MQSRVIKIYFNVIPLLKWADIFRFKNKNYIIKRFLNIRKLRTSILMFHQNYWIKNSKKSISYKIVLYNVMQIMYPNHIFLWSRKPSEEFRFLIIYGPGVRHAPFMKFTLTWNPPPKICNIFLSKPTLFFIWTMFAAIELFSFNL